MFLGPHRNIIFGFRDTDSGSSSGFRLWGGSKSVFLGPNLVFPRQNLEFLIPKTSASETKSSVSETISSVSESPRNTRFCFRSTDSCSSSGFRLWGGSKPVFL